MSEQPKEESTKKTEPKKQKAKIEVKNKLRRPLSITLSEDKEIYLEARGTAEISGKELESPVLQRFIKQGKLVVYGHE